MWKVKMDILNQWEFPSVRILGVDKYSVSKQLYNSRLIHGVKNLICYSGNYRVIQAYDIDCKYNKMSEKTFLKILLKEMRYYVFAHNVILCNGGKVYLVFM